MRLRLEARPEPSRLASWLSPVAATVAVILIGLVLFAFMGKDPWLASYTFFIDPIDTLYDIGELLLKASPIMLCAVGLAVGYRANVWNIGAEGQLIMGAICGGGVALAFQEAETHFVIPVMLVAGMLGGMAWAAIPALLRTRFNANEILVSLMLVYGVANLVQDLWHEQVVKRGWTESDIPSVTTPRLAAIWVLVLAGTGVVYALGFARRAEPAEPAIIS